ncbi:MAG: GEVED domain-containing protein [Phycisphaerae bacterium]|jgi:hypothetical protein
MRTSLLLKCLTAACLLAITPLLSADGPMDPQRGTPWNDDCSAVTPDLLVASGELIYQGDNTGATSDCSLYDAPEVWHAFTIAECMDVTVDFCGTTPAFPPGLTSLVDGCPCSSGVGSTMYDRVTCGDGNTTLYFFRLEPGTYYVPVRSLASEQHPYTLTIHGEACPPIPVNDDCGNVTPVDLNLGDVLTFTGTTLGATQTCDWTAWPGDVWDAIVTTEPLDITIDYCDTDPAFGYVGDALFQSCPCDGDSRFLAGLREYDSCSNGNGRIHYYNVPAGTWYIPTYSGLHALGLYVMHVSATAPTEVPECPEDSIYSQKPEPTGTMVTAPTSAHTDSFEYLCQDRFSNLTHRIGSVSWWGFNLHFDGDWYECDPSGVNFNVIFYADDNGMPGDPLFTFSDLTPTVTPTDLYYEDMRLYYFEIAALPECAFVENGWLSIQSQPNPNDCAFLWLGSWVGDGFSLQNGGTLGIDLAYCLGEGGCPVILGACCDELTGICVDYVPWDDCLGWGQQFTMDTLCAELDPACGTSTGACCHNSGDCEIVTFNECEALDGTWLGADTTCDECPTYCNAGSYNCAEHISYVKLGDVDNASGCGLDSGGIRGYSNYTNITFDMIAGQSYQFSVANGSADQPGDTCRAWIDWNRNYSFDDAGEAVIMTDSPGVGPYTVTITPPLDAVGLTRMRVRIVRYAPDDACRSSYFGEVEDYTIVVTPGLHPGDLNCDGAVNNFDISPFVLAITDAAGYAAAYPECNVLNADCNGDGEVNNFDIGPFVALITGG